MMTWFALLETVPTTRSWTPVPLRAIIRHAAAYIPEPELIPHFRGR